MPAIALTEYTVEINYQLFLSYIFFSTSNAKSRARSWILNSSPCSRFVDITLDNPSNSIYIEIFRRVLSLRLHSKYHCEEAFITELFVTDLISGKMFLGLAEAFMKLEFISSP